MYEEVVCYGVWNAGNIASIEIYQCLLIVWWWVRHVSDSGTGLKDMPRSGHTHAAAMVENEESGSSDL
jgi:hypothetical protein